MSSTPAELDTLLNCSAVPVLLDFWAPWCGPCKAMAPALDSLASDLKDRITLTKINIDETPELAAHFQIQAVPSLVLVHHGNVLERVVGARARPELERLLLKHLA